MSTGLNEPATFLDAYYAPAGPVNPAAARKVRTPDIAQEYLASGFLGYGDTEHALSRLNDDLQRMQGPHVYELISHDAKAGSALSVLPQAALQEGITYSRSDAHTLSPDETDDPEEARIVKASADKESEITGVPVKPAKKLVDPQKKQKIDDAQWALDFVTYNHRRASLHDRSIEEWLYEMIYEGLKYGSDIAERVADYQQEGEGPYPNMAVFGRLRTKHRHCWAYVVDSYGDLVGILGNTENPGEAVLLPPDKFSMFRWNPVSSDPRGRSHYRTVWQSFYHKTKTWGEWFKFMQQCASARTVGTLPEDEALAIEGSSSGGGSDVNSSSLDSDGRNSSNVPARKFRKNLEVFHNGTVMVIPFGAKVEAIPPQGNGDAFLRSIETCNNEMAMAIHNNPQITVEAKHSNKANAAQATDLGYLLFCYVAHCGARVVERLWHWLIAYNRGDAFADEFTPEVTLINTKNIDWTAQADALAKLYQVQFFVEKQLPTLDRRLGLAARNPGDKVAGPALPQTTSPFGPGSGRQVPAPPPEKAPADKPSKNAQDSI